MHLFILQQLMVILDMQWLLKGMHYIKVMIQVLTYRYCVLQMAGIRMLEI